MTKSSKEVGQDQFEKKRLCFVFDGIIMLFCTIKLWQNYWHSRKRISNYRKWNILLWSNRIKPYLFQLKTTLAHLIKLSQRIMERVSILPYQLTVHLTMVFSSPSTFYESTVLWKLQGCQIDFLDPIMKISKYPKYSMMRTNCTLYHNKSKVIPSTTGMDKWNRVFGFDLSTRFFFEQ